MAQGAAQSHVIHPTDGEAWAYLVQRGHRLEDDKLPSKVRDNIMDVLREKWDVKNHDINVHNFGLVWADPRCRALATRLCEVGPGRDAFDIDMINKLKSYRLGGVSRIL